MKRTASCLVAAGALAVLTISGCADLIGIVDLEEARRSDASTDGTGGTGGGAGGTHAGGSGGRASPDSGVHDAGVPDGATDSSAGVLDARVADVEHPDASFSPDASAFPDSATPFDGGSEPCARTHRGLVLWLPFDGNLDNRVAGAPDAESWDVERYAPGRVGLGARLANSTDGGYRPAEFLRVPTYAALHTPVAITVSAWVLADVWGGPIATRAPPGSRDGWSFETARGELSFCVGDFCIHGVLPDTGTFAQVTATLSTAPPEAHLYVDGVPIGATNQGAFPKAIPDLDGEVRVGADAMGNELFAGVLDEVAVWSRALSAADVHALFHAGEHGLCRDCIPVVEPLLSRWALDGRAANALVATPALPALTPSATFISGKIGGGADLFSGFLEGSADARLSPSASDFTVLTWVRRRSGLGFTGRILDRRDPATGDGWSLGANAGVVDFEVGGRKIAATLPNTDAFVHVAGRYRASVFDQSEVSVFVNGLSTTTAFDSLLDGSDAPAELLRLGADGNGGSRFAGVVDDVTIVGRALSAEEVADVVASAAPVCDSGPASPSSISPSPPPFQFAPSVAVRSAVPDSVEVFGVGADGLARRKRRTDGVWDEWKLVRSDATFSGSVDAASWDPARLDVVGPGTKGPGFEGHATHTWLIGSNFAFWADETGYPVTSVAFAAPRSNELWQFGVVQGGANDGKIGWRRFASQFWGPFSYPADLPSGPVDAAAFADTSKSPAVVTTWVSYLDGGNPAGAHLARFSATDGAGPVALPTLDLPMRAEGLRYGACVSAPTAARLDVVSVAADDDTLQHAQSLDGGATWVDWGGGARWKRLAGPVGSKPDCAAVSPSTLFVVARTADGHVVSTELSGTVWGPLRTLL